MRRAAQPARNTTIPHANLLDPPQDGSAVQFPDSFGQRSLLTVDTEEEFDWEGDFGRDSYGLAHVRWIAKFQEFCEGIGVSPVYLVDWPIARNPASQEIIGDAVRRGAAEVGVQLHPWVNPPFEEVVSARNSYAGNLPPALEAEKFRRLRDVIEDGFGAVPRIYRAGRYGLGPQTAQVLSEAGVTIDSSVRARYDYGRDHGPDYSRHPVTPYWSDPERRVLELPLTTVFWGMLRKQGQQLFPLSEKFPRLGGLLAKSGMLERISLTPEGVTMDEALRGCDIAIDDGLPILVLSFHSPSLAPGYTPYVRTEDDLDRLYDWLRGVHSYLRAREVRPTTVTEIIEAVQL